MTPWLQGWQGLMMAYGAVQVPMLAGLARGRSSVAHYLASPLVAAPLAAIVGIATAGTASWLPASAQVALGGALGVALGFASGLGTARRDRAESRRHERGTRLIEEEAAPERLDRARHAARGRDAAIRFAGVRLPFEDETKHFKLIGTTGTGKSTAIRELLDGALARGDRVIVTDPDGGYLRRYYDAARGDVILNPFDARSLKWDLYRELRQPYDADHVSRSLIPDEGGADRSWRGYARTFLSAVTRQTQVAGVEDVAELYRLLVVAEPKELRTLLRGTPAQPFLDEANARMFDSIRSVTSSAVGSLDHIARQRAAGFSVRDWVSGERHGALFMPYRAGQIASLRSVISGWMRLAIFETMEREEPEESGPAPHPLWFVVDELDALGSIDGLKDALARLRKFGGRCVLGFQSIAQVSGTYGPAEAHTIVENCSNSLILRCSASEGGGTARFASQLIGDREVTRTTRSRSRRVMEPWGSITHSEQYGVEPAVMASQIEQLPDLAGYLKQASSSEWRRVRLTSPAPRSSGVQLPPADEARMDVIQVAAAVGPQNSQHSRPKSRVAEIGHE